MPSTSTKQQRYFGAVVAQQRGTLKDGSDALKKTAASISPSDAADFAARVETPQERKARLVKSAVKVKARMPTEKKERKPYAPFGRGLHGQLMKMEAARRATYK